MYKYVVELWEYFFYFSIVCQSDENDEFSQGTGPPLTSVLYGVTGWTHGRREFQSIVTVVYASTTYATPWTHIHVLSNWRSMYPCRLWQMKLHISLCCTYHQPAYALWRLMPLHVCTFIISTLATFHVCSVKYHAIHGEKGRGYLLPHTDPNMHTHTNLSKGKFCLCVCVCVFGCSFVQWVVLL